MNLYDEFSAVVAALKRRRARFAVVGGLAMAFHDEPRFTRDIDLLLHSGDEGKLAAAMASVGYFESAKPWKFAKVPIVLRRFVRTEGEEFMPVDVLVGRASRIDAMVDGAVAHAWGRGRGRVKVARREDIVRLKRGRGSDQDKVDIRKLKK